MTNYLQDCNEEWRSVDGWGGWYEVSSLGRVRRTLTGDLLTTYESRRYLAVTLSGPRKLCIKVHRLVALAFLGPRPEGLQINHLDGDRHNNRAENLEYISRKGNVAHAVALRRCANAHDRDYFRHTCKLTKEMVKQIRSEYERGMGKRLAVRYGVSANCIRDVASRRSWQEV